MGAPTLSLPGRTLTLPSPEADAKNTRTRDERSISRRTIGGVLRRTVLSYAWVYVLGWRYATQADYDAIADLWRAAVAAGTFPTFSWDQYSTAAAVTVAVDLSEMQYAAPGLVAFEVTLTEVNPR